MARVVRAAIADGEHRRKRADQTRSQQGRTTPEVDIGSRGNDAGGATGRWGVKESGAHDEIGQEQSRCWPAVKMHRQPRGCKSALLPSGPGLGRPLPAKARGMSMRVRGHAVSSLRSG